MRINKTLQYKSQPVSIQLTCVAMVIKLVFLILENSLNLNFVQYNIILFIRVLLSGKIPVWLMK